MKNAKSLFLRVVETQSFKKTAEQFRMNTSSVSRHIAALESHLKVKLLNRSTAGTTPTELGQTYYNQLRKILDEERALDESITNQTKQISGQIKISAPVDFGTQFVLPACRKLQSKHPDLVCDLRLGSHFDNLVENSIDVAIRIGTLNDSNLIAVRLAEVPRVIVASKKYLANHKAPNNINELVQHNFVFYSSKQAQSDIVFTNGDTFSRYDMQGNFTVNSVNGIRELVLDGVGIHVGPAWFFSKAIKAGDIEILLPNYPVYSYPAYAVYVDRNYLPYKIKTFIKQLKQQLLLDDNIVDPQLNMQS